MTVILQTHCKIYAIFLTKRNKFLKQELQKLYIRFQIKFWKFNIAPQRLKFRMNSQKEFLYMYPFSVIWPNFGEIIKEHLFNHLLISICSFFIIIFAQLIQIFNYLFHGVICVLSKLPSLGFEIAYNNIKSFCSDNLLQYFGVFLRQYLNPRYWSAISILFLKDIKLARVDQLTQLSSPQKLFRLKEVKLYFRVQFNQVTRKWRISSLYLIFMIDFISPLRKQTGIRLISAILQVLLGRRVMSWLGCIKSEILTILLQRFFNLLTIPCNFDSRLSLVRLIVLEPSKWFLKEMIIYVHIIHKGLLFC